MKIAWIRYPQKFYSSNKVIRGGSEIANQIIIDYLRSDNTEVNDFSPETPERLDLISLPGIGNPLVFQDLIKKIDQINQNDLVVTTNWFGSIIPEIKKPLVIIFHASSKLVTESIEEKNIEDKDILDKWLKRAQEFQIGNPSHQELHETIIGIEENYYVENASHIIAVSDYIKEGLVRFYNADPDKITVIHNTYPFDWQDVKVEKDFNIDMLNVVVLTRMPSDHDGFVGKGVYRIFEALEQLKGVGKTLIASTTAGVYDEFIEKYSEGTQYFENVGRSEVKDHLLKSHISLHFSRCEAFMMTLIESMLMGNVPISFNVGVAGNLIKNGQNGFIVKSVKEAIEKVDYLNANRDEAKTMALAARETVLREIPVDKIGKEYIETFSKIINK